MCDFPSPFTLTRLGTPIKLWLVLSPACTTCLHVWGVWVPGYQVPLCHTVEVLGDTPVGFLSAKHSPACSHYVAATLPIPQVSHLCLTTPRAVLLLTFNSRSHLFREAFQMLIDLRTFFFLQLTKLNCLWLSSGLNHSLHSDSSLWDFFLLLSLDNVIWLTCECTSSLSIRNLNRLHWLPPVPSTDCYASPEQWMPVGSASKQHAE